MQKSLALAALAAATLVCAGAASAQGQNINGTVYRTTANGVYIQTRQGITYVPNESADFRIGNMVVRTNGLVKGKPYQIRYDEDYQPSYVPTQYYQEYYKAHKDWEWDRYQNGWKSDRKVWVQDSNGNWRRRGK